MRRPVRGGVRGGPAGDVEAFGGLGGSLAVLAAAAVVRSGGLEINPVFGHPAGAASTDR